MTGSCDQRWPECMEPGSSWEQVRGKGDFGESRRLRSISFGTVRSEVLHTLIEIHPGIEAITHILKLKIFGD